MPLRQSEQGSCVAKKTQSLGLGRPSAGEAKNCWMQLISPCRSGETRSLLVATVCGSRPARERMAAPKSLLPDDTPARDRGTIFSSVTRRILERISAGVFAIAPESSLCFSLERWLENGLLLWWGRRDW